MGSPMERELQLHAVLNRENVNFMTALMPTLEGLLIITVLDGKKGEIVIRYHPTVADQVIALTRSLEATYGEGFRIISHETGTT